MLLSYSIYSQSQIFNKNIICLFNFYNLDTIQKIQKTKNYQIIIKSQPDTFSIHQDIQNCQEMIKDKMYFSQQGILSNLCAVHAVNNLIGATFFSQQSFDDICKFLEKQTRSLGLDIRNRHIIGGDYDANVILKAVQNCGLTTKWIDSRQKFKYKYQKGAIPKGYIINIRQKQNVLKKFLKLSDRHWICVKLQGMDWYLLDSKKQEPQIIQDVEEYINNLLKQGSQVIEIRIEVNKKQEQQIQLNQHGQDRNQQNKVQDEQKQEDKKQEQEKQKDHIGINNEQKQIKIEKCQQKIDDQLSIEENEQNRIEYKQKLQPCSNNEQNIQREIKKQVQQNEKKDKDNQIEQLKANNIQ